MHRIAEIKGYAAVVFVFCESEVVMKLWLLAFLVVFFSFFQLDNDFSKQRNFLGTDFLLGYI